MKQRRHSLLEEQEEFIFTSLGKGKWVIGEVFLLFVRVRPVPTRDVPATSPTEDEGPPYRIRPLWQLWWDPDGRHKRCWKVRVEGRPPGRRTVNGTADSGIHTEKTREDLSHLFSGILDSPKSFYVCLKKKHPWQVYFSSLKVVLLKSR